MHLVSLVTKWRQQFQPMLSPLRGFDSKILFILGADAQANCFRPFGPVFLILDFRHRSTHLRIYYDSPMVSRAHAQGSAGNAGDVA